MKSNQLTKVLAIVLIIGVAAGCKQKPSATFELKGKLTNITDGKIVLSGTMEEGDKTDTVLIKNGEFVFTTEITEGAQYKLEIAGSDGYPMYFYAENTQMALTGRADSLYMCKITGGTINEDEQTFNDGMQKIYEKFSKEYQLDSLFARYSRTKNEGLRKEIDSIDAIMTPVFDKYETDFIKQHPASYYSAILLSYKAEGQSAKELEESLKQLDPKLDDFAVVEDIRQMIEDKKTTDVNLDAFTSNAPDVDYAVDKSYSGSAHTDIVYLAALPNDDICTLKKDGVVSILDAKGAKTGGFKTTLKATPTAMAVDKATGNIYILGTLNKTKEVKQRGKTYKIDEPQGVECLVYDAKGTEIKKIALAEPKTATGAKVIDNKLLVADFNSKKVFIYNLETGKMESAIKDLRACCRILDFGINNKNEILVANLGAFRVQAFDYTGKIKYAFGKRGQGLNDFHGCCNPVNVASLTSGAIVTVEKDPTRIKVYSKSGAKQIAGIQELVKGCAYIPMTSDSKNNLYLASAKSGIVKCSITQSK